MTGPTRATVAGRAFRDLQNLAKRQGRDIGDIDLLATALPNELTRRWTSCARSP
ncbi:hypothetical protein GCM10009547_48190 [Sporichthya brevicatena]|uniref:Uncharacterized protein n=1 Tax=Sporichthya brevicatena TaxID=171442 RepID=A0ABP3SGQ7_9ACTN